MADPTRTRPPRALLVLSLTLSLALTVARATLAQVPPQPPPAADAKGAEAAARARLFAQPGEDPPQPFVPLHPRTVEARKQLEALRNFAAARALEDGRRLVDAVDLLEQALKDDPDSVPILRRLGRLHLVLQHVDKAVAYSRRVLAAQPDDTATLNSLVNYYLGRKNDPGAAEGLIQEVLANPGIDARSPAYLLAHFRLGEIYATRLGRLDRAADEFARVVEALDDKAANRLTPADQKRILGNDESEAYLLFGETFLEAKRLDLAIKAFGRGLVYDPEHPLIPLRLARALPLTTHAAEALDTINAYLRRQPQGGEAYELLIAALSALNRLGEVVPRLEEAVRNDSKNLPLQYLLADRYREAGQEQKANELYKALALAQPGLRGFGPLFDALLKEKKTEDLLRLLESTYVPLQRFEPLKPQLDRLVADKAYLAQVLDTGRKMLAADPPELGRASWPVLIRLANEAEDHDRLVAIQREYLARFPSAMVYREIVDTLYRSGKFADAATTVEEMLARYPDERTPLVLVYLGGARSQAGQYDRAIEAGREALKLDPHNSDALRLIMRSEAASGQLDRAIATAREALKAEAADAELNYLLGQFLSQAGKNDEAIAHFKAQIERFKDNDDIVKLLRSSLSIVYTNIGDFARGEAELETLLAREPNDPRVNNDLGYLWADQGKNLERAEEMIRKAVKAEPENSSYLDSLGWVLFKRGKAAEAVAPLEQAVKALPPGDTTGATVLEHLGDVQFELKDWSRARTAWDRAAEVAARAAPPDKRLPEIRKKLQALEKLGAAPSASTGEKP